MRRAFTLIELMVVTTVLVLLTGLVLPNVVAMKKAREHQEAYNAVLRLAQKGREAAITSGKTYTLTFTNSGATLSLQPDTDSTNALSRDGQGGDGGGSNSVSSAQRGSNLNSTGGSNGVADESGTADFPANVTAGQMTLAGKGASTGDFTLHFYPDGRSDGGGFELVDGSSTRNLSVSTSGIVTMSDGALPATTETTWQAGTYAQRTTS